MSPMIGKYELSLNYNYSGRVHHYHDPKCFLVKSSLPDGGEVDVVGPAGPRRGGEGSC